MDRDPHRNRGKTFLPDLFSSFPTSWEDFEDKMGYWFGKTTGVTVSEDDKNVYVEAHLPGLKPEELDVSLDRNTLKISGERKEESKDDERKFHSRAQRSFYYQVELPTQVEENTEQAQYQNGILQISFKKTRKDNIKKIAVKQGFSGSTSSKPDNEFKKNGK